MSSNSSGDVVRPRSALDLNPAGDVVEVLLVAHPWLHSFDGANVTSIYAYNGGTPGPTIEAEVGDRLIVHFVNLLPEETTVHWHGVEVPAAMDGSNISQAPVEAGGYFRYEFTLLRAATFWYHPHIRSNEQVENGLYGMAAVRDPGEDAALGLPEEPHELLLDDVLLDDTGQIAEPFPADPLENALAHVNGRDGNTFLVNGRAGRTASIRRGVPQRLRLVNTSNTRFMRVSLDGHTLHRIGGDGGLLEAPLALPPVGLVEDPDNPSSMISDPDPSKGLLLTPGERADVVFTPHARDIDLEWHDIPRGRHSAFFTPMGTIGLGDAEDDGRRPSQLLMTFRSSGRDRPEFELPPMLRDIEPIDSTGAAPIVATFGHTPPDAAGEITFFVQVVDGVPRPFPAVTPDIAPMAKVGETRIWEVNNLTGGDHNFHPHGFVFQHLETQFVDMDNPDNNFTVASAVLEDKDTILIPRRPGAAMRSRSITRLAVRFDGAGREGSVEAFGGVPGPGASGGWVFHCHLLEHVDNGMMSYLQLFAP